MQVEVICEKQEFICASTDGLEKVAIRLSDWKPFSPFFKPLEEYLHETVNPKEDKYLTEFLNSERLNSRTDDDKTLLLCLFDRE
ncbi:protein phosphatase 2C domain-containing protein [Nostoc sp. TCL240-02]|nr:protein phosphatase 2C domain-containing protein [Nostoc sp. TCL240-02]